MLGHFCCFEAADIARIARLCAKGFSSHQFLPWSHEVDTGRRRNAEPVDANISSWGKENRISPATDKWPASQLVAKQLRKSRGPSVGTPHVASVFARQPVSQIPAGKLRKSGGPSADAPHETPHETSAVPRRPQSQLPAWQLRDKIAPSIDTMHQGSAFAKRLQYQSPVWELPKKGGSSVDTPHVASTFLRDTNHLHNMDTEDLLIVVRSLGTMGGGSSNSLFMQALKCALLEKLPDFSPKRLAALVRCFASLGHYDISFMSALLAASSANMSCFDAQDLGDLAWAQATLRHHDPAFLSAVVAAVQPKLRAFPQSHLTDLVWALAVLNHADVDFLSALADACRARMQAGEFAVKTLVPIAWAWAILDHTEELSAEAMIHAFVKKGSGRMQPVPSSGQGAQFFQYLTHLSDHGVLHDLSTYPGLDQMHRDLRAARMLEAKRTSPSEFQKELTAVCRQMILHGVRMTVLGEEYLTNDGLFSIDLALSWDQQLPGCNPLNIAVEVDGPTHFTTNAPYKMLGKTAFRNRCLTHRGWRVLAIPWFEWERMGATPQAKMYSLLRRLQTIGGSEH